MPPHNCITTSREGIPAALPSGRDRTTERKREKHFIFFRGILLFLSVCSLAFETESTLHENPQKLGGKVQKVKIRGVARRTRQEEGRGKIAKKYKSFWRATWRSLFLSPCGRSAVAYGFRWITWDNPQCSPAFHFPSLARSLFLYYSCPFEKRQHYFAVALAPLSSDINAIFAFSSLASYHRRHSCVSILVLAPTNNARPV